MTNDITGQKFGMLTVLGKVSKPEDKKERTTYWECLCDCGKTIIRGRSTLVKGEKNGRNQSCGCTRENSNNKVNARKDITGKRFGRWLALEQVEDHIEPDGRHIAQWLCLCDCGNQKIIAGYALRKGNSKSCGCLAEELKLVQQKKYNTYDLTSKDYGIGYTLKGEEFWFDKEDYDLIKDYCWHYGTGGYLKTNLTGGGYLVFHRFVMGATNENWLSVIVDHKQHGTMDELKFDNRKENLRKVTRSRNNQNTHKRKDNTSGVTGVSWHKIKKAWKASINVNKEHMHLGYFDNFEDAVKARKEAEEKYFGEFSYDNSQKQHREDD